jgi:hypothetical protein
VYRRTSPLYPTLRELRRFATVVLCDWGCRSEKTVEDSGSPGIMHHKFVTISDMAWRRGVDPVVVSSSANWSRSQLADHWQSALMVYRDQRLYTHFAEQWRLLAGCAQAGGCGTWSQGNDDASMASFNGIWYDDPSDLRVGDEGRGSAAAFSPWSGEDPLVTDLHRYGCSAGHGTVRVAHMFVTRGRHRVLDALGRLRRLGCDVDVVLSSTGSELSLEGIELAREAGLDVTCTPRMHDKLVMVDALDPRGEPEQVVWAGSQSLGGNALRRNEEALLRLSAGDASADGRETNGHVFRQYAEYWQDMRRQEAPCGSGPEHELSQLATLVTGEPVDEVLPQ